MKDPKKLTHEELEGLSKKPQHELSEKEKEALAKARFYCGLDEKSLDKKIQRANRNLKEALEKLRKEKQEEKNGNKNN